MPASGGTSVKQGAVAAVALPLVPANTAVMLAKQLSATATFGNHPVRDPSRGGRSIARQDIDRPARKTGAPESLARFLALGDSVSG